MRDDPFYLADDRHAKPKIDDVDNIPVVRLDDLPPLPQSTGARVLLFQRKVRVADALAQEIHAYRV